MENLKLIEELKSMENLKSNLCVLLVFAIIIIAGFLMNS